MKKLIACISLVFAMSAGVTALADGVTYEGGTVTTDTTGFNTVLIQEDKTNGAIVYVNQADGGFGATADFLIKADAADGDYVLKMGGGTTAAVTRNFTISSFKPVDADLDLKTKVKDANGNYTFGTYAENVTLSNATYIRVTATKNGTSKTVYIPSGFEGDGSTSISIKVTDVPADCDISFGISNYKPESSN